MLLVLPTMKAYIDGLDFSGIIEHKSDAYFYVRIIWEKAMDNSFYQILAEIKIAWPE